MICLLQHVKNSKVFLYTFFVNKISDCEINIIVLFEGKNKSYLPNTKRANFVDPEVNICNQ